MNTYYTYIPLDLDQALKDGRLRAFDYALGCHLACESYRELNTNEGIVTAHISALADTFDCDPVTIRRALRRLKAAGWIDFPEPDERQRTPWPITLTRLAREAQTKGTATPTATPPLRLKSQTTATGDGPTENAKPHQEKVSAASPLRPSRVRENETKRNEQNLSSNAGRKENDLGKTTAAETDPAITDRLIALARGERPELEGETGVLADLQALVDAGVGEWTEDDAEGKQ